MCQFDGCLGAHPCLSDDTEYLADVLEKNARIFVEDEENAELLRWVLRIVLASDGRTKIC